MPSVNLLKTTRYSTAVFSSLSANAYDYIVVSEGFFNSTVTFNETDPKFNSIGSPGRGIIHGMHEAFLNGTLRNTSSSQCMEKYGTNFVSKFGNFLLVTVGSDATTSLLFTQTVGAQWFRTHTIGYVGMVGAAILVWKERQFVLRLWHRT